MKKLLLVICFLGTSVMLRAQQGRAEMPIDTLPIGGKQEEAGLTQMEGQDELIETMKSLKDSVTTFLSHAKKYQSQKESIANLRATLERFSGTLAELEKSEKNTAKMRLGYAQTKELRAQFDEVKNSEVK